MRIRSAGLAFLAWVRKQWGGVIGAVITVGSAIFGPVSGWAYWPWLVPFGFLVLTLATGYWAYERAHAGQTDSLTRDGPVLRVYPTPISSAAKDGYTYLRLDMNVINDGKRPASNIIVKVSSPPSVQTVAEYFTGRQAFTPGEGQFDISTAPRGPDGYRTATNMLASAPPLQGNDIIAYQAGTAVVYAKNGNYIFRWFAFCQEDLGAGTAGSFTISVSNGVAKLIP